MSIENKFELKNPWEKVIKVIDDCCEKWPDEKIKKAIKIARRIED